HEWMHMIVRWLILLLVPYGLVPLLAALIIGPSLVLWGTLSSGGLSHKLSTGHFAAGIALAAVVSVAAFSAGHRPRPALVRRRHATPRRGPGAFFRPAGGSGGGAPGPRGRSAGAPGREAGGPGGGGGRGAAGRPAPPRP